MNRRELEGILREKGLKVTNQRLFILETLADNEDRHLTVEEIYDSVKSQFPSIGLATVYRNIQLLLSLKLIESIRFDDGCTRYEIGKLKAGIQEHGHRHHHLICKECGEVISFRDDLLEELEDKIYQTAAFQVIDHEVKLYGYCEHCLKKRNRQ